MAAFILTVMPKDNWDDVRNFRLFYVLLLLCFFSGHPHIILGVNFNLRMNNHACLVQAWNKEATSDRHCSIDFTVGNTLRTGCSRTSVNE